MTTKPINSVNVDVHREYLINKVIPEVVEKWPRSHRYVMIKIQQDDAGPHIKEDWPAFVAASRANSLNTTLSFHPSNSLELNVLDLGYCTYIQSIQYNRSPSNVDHLIQAVK